MSFGLGEIFGAVAALATLTYGVLRWWKSDRRRREEDRQQTQRSAAELRAALRRAMDGEREAQERLREEARK